MRTLTIVPMPAPEAAPNLDMQGAGKWVALADCMKEQS